MKNNMDNTNGYKVITLCDFGTPTRRDILARHKTYATAFRQYPRLWDIYHKLHGWKVWQEEVTNE